MNARVFATQPLQAEIDGRLEAHRDGHGFLIPDDGSASVWLSPQEMRTVMHGDKLRVRVVRLDRKGRPEGRVLDILDRKRGPLIGRLLHEGGIWLVAPEDRRYGRDILIPKGSIGGAQAGQVVVVELTEPPSMLSEPVGKVTEILGDIDDPGMEIEIAVRKFDVPHRFSDATIDEAQALPDTVQDADWAGRVDLTDVPLVTIDGLDARDFDDAVYCEPFTKGRGKSAVTGWRMLVAIADVSHYVKPGEPLDVDAYTRATSVYFPRRVIPMLPEKLSNGLCSLNPEVERLSMVCDMVVDASGEVTAYQFYPAVIRSHARLTYDEVAAILTNTRAAEDGPRAELVPQLIDLHEVYRALFKRRQQRGALEFETTETKIVCDDAGRIEKIVPMVRNDAHKLIEEAMLAANVCAAEYIGLSKQHALFRVHEGPTPEKRTALQAYLRALGVQASVSETPKPKDLQAIAELTRDRPDAAQIHTMLLRSMQQAIYTPFNSGHFGLAYEAYAHFTSPIRRYPDLLVHRAIKAILAKKPYRFSAPAPSMTLQPRRGGAVKMSTALGVSAIPVDPPSSVGGGKAKAAAKTDIGAWEVAGAHTSACERRADEASRDVVAWLKCRYMREHLGEVYAGTVTGVAAFGLFVTLDAMYVEGLVHISELGGEYWQYDEVRQELRGERSGMRYAVGSRMDVQVSRVDLDARKIDFRIVRPGDEAALLARGRKTGSAAGGSVKKGAAALPAGSPRGTDDHEFIVAPDGSVEPPEGIDDAGGQEGDAVQSLESVKARDRAARSKSRSANEAARRVQQASKARASQGRAQGGGKRAGSDKADKSGKGEKRSGAKGGKRRSRR